MGDSLRLSSWSEAKDPQGLCEPRASCAIARCETLHGLLGPRRRLALVTMTGQSAGRRSFGWRLEDDAGREAGGRWILALEGCQALRTLSQRTIRSA
jgi:hypothetical protein